MTQPLKLASRKKISPESFDPLSRNYLEHEDFLLSAIQAQSRACPERRLMGICGFAGAGTIARAGKPQIPPLRFASVGMTQSLKLSTRKKNPPESIDPLSRDYLEHEDSLLSAIAAQSIACPE